jgi:putative spermidine/putrescine transport system ATP-binding protein
MTGVRAEAIDIRALTKRYGGFAALDRVDLHIEGGEFLTLLGPSGSGKTTLLMVLAGFVRPTSGAVEVGGQDLTRVPPHKRDFGMVFQNYALFPHMSVAENIAYPLKLRGLDRDAIGGKVEDALRLVQLEHLAERGVHQLSGGQRQRIALARAVVFEPRVLLMDEPLSALDKKLREQMQIEIRHLHEKLGITTVYVTHDQREALTMSDRIAVINEGRVIQVAEPALLYNRPADAFVADFVGESSMLPVEANGSGYTFHGRPLQAITPGEGAAPARGLLVVRPEKLELFEPGMEADHNCFEGVIEEVVYQGETVFARIRLDEGAELTLRRTTGRQATQALGDPGNRVVVALHEDDSVVVPERRA